VWVLVDDEVIKHMTCSEEASATEWLAIMIDTLKHEDPTRAIVTLWAI
jgi:hypothetical protein